MSTKAQVKTPAKTPAAPAAARIIQPPVGVPEHEADRPDIAAQLEGAARLGHSLGAISVDSYRRPIIQRQETTAEEEDAPELKPGPAAIQRQEIPEEEEEELQLKPGPAAVQRQEIPEKEEEELQMMRAPAEQVALQRQELPEEKEELMMTRDDQRVGPQGGPVAPDVDVAIQRATGGAASEVRQENRTGLPDNLKAGLEDLSGLAMDDVRVHYNSSKPAEINAHAFTQGKDIHIASGQEKHLPHEAWHVVQQKQGRVKPTFQLKGEQVNDDQVLETEADAMGKKAVQMRRPARVATGAATQATTAELRERGATDASEVLSVAIGACGEKVHLNSRSTRRDDAPIQRSLLVGDELYTLSQLRKIGEEVKHKYDTDLGFQKAFKETNPVYKDLTWKQMLDPRINILINSAERYQFESWTALQEAIDSIWGTGEEKIPEKINSDYKMKLEEGPMKFEGSLEDLIEKLGSKSEWVQLKVDELWEAAKKSTNQKEAIRNLQTLWGACGPSAQALIERIAALGGKPKKILDKYCVGKYDASELQTLLLLPVKGTTLIQINEEKIHQYTIEKRTDGKAYFHQGYLSGYTAYWWAGLVNDVEPFLTLGAKAAEEIKKQRDIYGKLKAIPLETLASKLGEYLLTDVHGEASDKIWRTMPFHPEGSEELRWKGKTITLQVEVYQMGNESAVHQALEDTEETLPLIKLVMTETKKLIDSLNK